MSEQVSFSEAPSAATIKCYSPGGYDVLLTVRDADTSSLVKRLNLALGWLEQNGYRPTTNGARTGANGNGAAPTCPTHNQVMKSSKHGGWFCPIKVADDDGAGRAVYCKQRVQ